MMEKNKEREISKGGEQRVLVHVKKTRVKAMKGCISKAVLFTRKHRAHQQRPK